jgi:hypothetical protein
MRRAVLGLMLSALAAGPEARAGGWDFATCLEGAPKLDILACSAASGGLSPVAAQLAVVACIMDNINWYQLRILDCLDTQITDIHAIVMFPGQARRVFREFKTVWEEGVTLKQQVESLACGWRFSSRSALLRDLYLKPIRLCRPEVKLIFGDHSPFFDGDVHELYDWTSKNTRNLIHERTVGPVDGGDPERGPEGTWEAVATDTAAQIVGLEEDKASEAWALRYGAQLASDRLQVQTNTLQLRAQQLLVEQQRRDYRAVKRQYESALRLFVLTQATKGAGANP